MSPSIFASARLACLAPATLDVSRSSVKNIRTTAIGIEIVASKEPGMPCRRSLLGLGWSLDLELTSIELIRDEVPGGGACL
jgi:hypothetical protein